MNICIVDDDKYVVEKIVDGIEWKKWDIEGIYVAYNIKQAKEILSTLQIDILLSDIEMPQGSGLELLEWVREQKLPLECIYLSSYAHFAYAQKALALQSKGYLLKPVSNKELSNVLENLVAQMKQEKGGCVQDRQKEKESYWRKIFLGEECGVADYGGNDSITLCLLRIFNAMEHKKIQDDTMLYLSLKHMVEEFMHEQGFYMDVMLRHSDNYFIIVLKNCKMENKTFRHAMAELLSCMEEELHITACIYVGKQCGIKDSKEQFAFLFQMVHEGVANGEGLLLGDEWAGSDAVYIPPNFPHWEQRMMHSQDMDGVSSEITDYVGRLWSSGRVNVKVFNQFKSDLQQMIFHYMTENGIVMNQIFEAGEFEYYCDKAPWTLRGMQEFISILFRKLNAVLKAENTEENVVEQIMHYIDENISGDLSRAKLAAQAYISEDYLSKKFSMHTGMSIPAYISAKRMEKACEYFKNTSHSVSEVAILVGYTNFSYFSKMFRDYAGCTPNEYKNKYNRNF